MTKARLILPIYYWDSMLNFNKSIFIKGLLLCLVLLFVLRLTGDFLPLNLVYLLVASTGLVLVYRVLYFSVSRLNKSPVYWGWILLNILIIISFAWTNAPQFGFSKLTELYLFIIIPTLFSVEWLKNYRYFRYLFSVIYALMLLYLIVFQRQTILANLAGEAISLKFGLTENSNSNVIAAMFGFGIINILSFFQFKLNGYVTLGQRMIRLSILGLVVLSIVFIILVGSKGAILALVLAYMTYFLVINFNLKGMAYIVLAVICTIPFLFIDFQALGKQVLPDPLYRYMEYRYFGEDEAQSYSSRKMLWSKALKGTANSSPVKMLVGNGVGDYGYLYTSRDDRGYPHNIFLEILYEFGILGLLLFTSALIYIVLKNREFRNYSSPELKWIFITFYFFFFRSLTTGSISGNFILFAYIILLFRFFSNADSFFMITRGKDKNLREYNNAKQY